MNQLFSSSNSMDMERHYLWAQYPGLRRENNPQYGAASPEDIRFRLLTYDELCYLLSGSGRYLILFGGSWCPRTQQAVPLIQSCAERYGVEAVYLFDFRMDGVSRDSDIQADLTEQPSYTGPGQAAEKLPGAEWNHLYGELAARFLTNLADWVGGSGHITWLDRMDEVRTAPRVETPFLFLYDRANTTDHSGRSRSGGRCPIVYGMEVCVDGDCGETVRQLEDGIFSHLEEPGAAPGVYTHEEYLREAYRINSRGHSMKTQDAFTPEEPIQIQMMPFHMLDWLLDQEGTFLILIGGAWCSNTQAAISVINDYAVANNVRVYMFDFRLDGKYPFDFWEYPRARELKITGAHSPFRRLYIDMVERKLVNLTTVQTFGGWDPCTVQYTDEAGRVHIAGRVQAPHLLAYQKGALNPRGKPAPVLAYCERMYELINCQDTFIYCDPNYKDYKAGVYKVIYTYCQQTGGQAREITSDKTQPVISGAPVKHQEPAAYHRAHNWEAELPCGCDDACC
ncbi:MAG: hypothetical protein LUE61_09935 [Clostridiales bacterium]|nr:hypothetical protein [Clostridiales bacterium]